MYRVFKVSSFSYNSYQAFHPHLSYFHGNNLKCTLCNKIGRHQIIGGNVFEYTSVHYSTSVSTNPSVSNPNKRRKNLKRSKYIELLEVSKNRTSERRARVKTLNAQSWAKLREFEDVINQAPIETISEVEHDFDGRTIEMFENQEAEETLTELQNEPKKEVKGSSVYTRLSSKNKEKLTRSKVINLDSYGKENSFNSSLVSYVELCMNCGFLNRGWYTVQYYLKNNKKLVIKDDRVFSILMECCAKNGNIDRLLDIWKTMVETASIKPSAVSFARRFETIVRSKKKDKAQLLASTMRLMRDEGISCNDIFEQTKWKLDSREVVLSAIKAVQPQFAPKVKMPNTEYNCALVNHLNRDPEKLVSPAESMFSVGELNNLFKEQLEMEKKTFVKVKSIEKSKLEKDTFYCRNAVQQLEKEWEKAISTGFHKDLVNMSNLQQKLHRTHSPINIYPYLTVLDQADYVEIIKQEVRKLAAGSETYSSTVPRLCRALGNMVKIRYDIKCKSSNGVLQKLENVFDAYSKWYLTPNVARYGYNPRHTWQLLKSQYSKGPSLDIDSEPWPIITLIAVGKFLYNIILRDIKIDINILKHNNKNKHYLPAFYTLFRHESKHCLEEVKPHPVLSRLYKGASSPDLYFSVTDLPMLSPPLPWNEPSSGGYLIARSPLIRLPHSAILQWERLKERPANLLYPCLDSLNQLGSIPWKVNKPVLDIVIKLFNSGGHEKLKVPCMPPALTQSGPSRAAIKEEKYEDFRARMMAKRRRAEMYSLWCDALYRLSLANHFRDRIFWLPHNMDFRGRVYPCPPHLNHLGSDLYRSLLVFAQSRPLGPDGLNWLKIHAINITGLKKKESIRSRLDYANEILPTILDSANNPFKKGAWWMESEKPWQTLATCFEIRNALNHKGGPESYLCSFPVHQDGSCNGLQHYAALGRDTSGAESVNLAPSDVPQDVYACVAAIVDRERAKDSQNGVEIAQHLDGFIQRKVIKQTVMTTVYGVTRYGARLQIAKQLKDLEDFPKEHIWQGSHYLVRKTFYSIAEMFTSTREIQDWFTESAQLIAGIRGENVEYVTPLGLPVVQPYSKNVTRCTSAARCSGVVSHNIKQDKFERPNVIKQKNAFPPNFIHSLDSTHMMLTSLHCQRAGITFVSVHDCFWTHPDTVHIMNKVCREQFVSLHSQPILQELSDFLASKYGFDESLVCESHPEIVLKAMKKLNVVLRAIPSTGDFQLEKVLSSVYFFS